MRHLLVTSARTDDELRDLKKEVVSLIKTIEKDTKFEPAESKLCDWCDYPEYCLARKHELKVQDFRPNKYLKEKGVTLVNKYADIKSRIRELKEQEEALHEELIGEAAVAYAQREDITSITGSDHMLKVKAETVLKFPCAKDERRKELEKCVKDAGIWERVSTLSITRLSKLVKSDALDKKISGRLQKLGEESEEVSEGW